jgi:hypothetical protein
MGLESATATLQLIDGLTTEVPALSTSQGAVDEGKLPALNAKGILDDSILDRVVTSLGPDNAGQSPKFGPDGKLSVTVLPEGVGPDITVMASTEDLAPGAWVHIDPVSSMACNANASGREVHGFVLEGVAALAMAKIYTTGRNTGVKGQKTGPVFLSTTAGQGTAIPVKGKGLLSQRVGQAVSETCVIFAPQQPVRLAR